MFRRLAPLAMVSIVWAAAPAQAAPVSMTLSPMTVELPAKPRQELTGAITLTHELPPGMSKAEAGPLRVRVYAMDWDLDRKGQPTFLKPGAVTGSCSKWVQLQPIELTVPAGESREARYTIKVPDGVQGTFRTVIMFETAPQPKTDGARVVAVNGRIGTSLYVLAGAVSRRARISSFSATPQMTSVTVENTGTSHVRLKGTLNFRDEAGKMVSQVPLPGGVVLPGASNLRDLAVETPKMPGSGKYSVTAVLDYGGEVLVGARAHLTIP